VNNAAVQTAHVFPARDKIAPPGLLDLSLQFAADGTVVVETGVAVVDLAAGENEAAALAQADDLVHGVVDGQGFDLVGFVILLHLAFCGSRRVFTRRFFGGREEHR